MNPIDFVLRLQVRVAGKDVPVHLAKQSLRLCLADQDYALKHNLRGRRHTEVVGVALDQLQGLARHRAHGTS